MATMLICIYGYMAFGIQKVYYQVCSNDDYRLTFDPPPPHPNPNPPSCPYMIKHKTKQKQYSLKNFLLQIQESFEAESWYIASGMQDLHVYSNDDPRMIFDCLGNVKFASLYFYMGKMLKNYFLKKY